MVIFLVLVGKRFPDIMKSDYLTKGLTRESSLKETDLELKDGDSLYWVTFSIYIFYKAQESDDLVHNNMWRGEELVEWQSN